MKSSIKNFSLYALFVITCVAVVLIFIQNSHVTNLKRIVDDQKSQFDLESSYVMETIENIILTSLKIDGQKFAITVLDQEGKRLDAESLVKDKGKRFFLMGRQQNCSICLETELLYIQENFTEKQRNKFALLLDMPVNRDRIIFSKKYGIETYHIVKDKDILFDKLPSITYFDISEYLIINSIYFPVKFLPNLSEEYLSYISSKIK